LKNTNNYIGQTSAAVLAKQNQFRTLCDAKHINRDKLVSMLGGSTKVNQEFKVLEGMLASTHLQDNRNHNQVVISKEKALVLVAAAETFRREFVPSKKKKMKQEEQIQWKCDDDELYGSFFESIVHQPMKILMEEDASCIYDSENPEGFEDLYNFVEKTVPHVLEQDQEQKFYTRYVDPASLEPLSNAKYYDY